MAIPPRYHIQDALLLYLSKVPNGTRHCTDAYRDLAKLFPQLTYKETNWGYQESKSKWANKVQYARWYWVKTGFIFDAKSSPMGRGYWTITEEGQQYIEKRERYIENSLKSVAKLEALFPDKVKKEIENIVATEENKFASTEAFNPTDIQDGRVRAVASIVRRRGQSEFRQKLLKIYGGKCAITRENAEQALEASHIIPYKGDKTNHPSNGLLLRADLHTLFDLRLLGVDTTNMTVILAPELMTTSYRRYAGKPLNLPSNLNERPSVEALDIHRRECGI